MNVTVDQLDSTNQTLANQLSHEDHVGVNEWLVSHVGDVPDVASAQLILVAVDRDRHVYLGTNKLDYGRRINCYRPACPDIHNELRYVRFLQ